MHKIIFLILIILLIPTVSAISTDKMIKELNTPENIFYLTYYLDNPERSVLPSASEFDFIKVIKFTTDDQIYCFIKRSGIRKDCQGLVSPVDTYIVNPNHIKFTYYNQDFMTEIMQDGEISYFDVLYLSIKYQFFNPQATQ